MKNTHREPIKDSNCIAAAAPGTPSRVSIVSALLFALAVTGCAQQEAGAPAPPASEITESNKTAKLSPAESGPIFPVAWDQGPADASEPADQRPPNIIFILADDLGINDISTFGGGVAGGAVPTPNIDQLAAAGATFTQSYAGHGTCAPSRAMLMTGRYSTRTGFEYTPTRPGFSKMVAGFGKALDNNLPEYLYSPERAATKPPYDEQGLPVSEVTIANVLRQRGYHTAHIGKWHLGTTDKFHPIARGFDESLLMTDLLHLPENDPRVVNARLAFDPIDKTLWKLAKYGASFNNGATFTPEGYLADYYTEESLKVIEANKNRPFFLYLGHWGVHTPLQATREDYEAVGDIKPHRLRVYAAMIRSIDRSVGRIMDKLEAEGLADNTMVVFSSDNGGAGYLGLPEVNAPYRGWKITLHEGGIRAPLFIKWPERIQAGTSIATPVAHIDVMPTLAAAAGAPLPKDVVIDGKNLLPLATGIGEITRENDALFWQSGYLQVVRADGWKLITEGKRNKSWLYHLIEDPTEQHNLAETHPEKLAELQALLAGHQAGSRGPLYPSVSDSPVMIDKTMADRFEEGDEYIYWPN
mgnify:CR=1 FL=1